ncbi:hypothetical protein H6G28_07065 [Nostoc sp. FACHB-190]|nr:hypothetical protein [Nostoc sp. FACHB-190]
MSQEHWYFIKNYYQNPSMPTQYLSFEVMAWLVDQIIESRFSNLFFPLLSHQALHIQISSDWCKISKLSKVTIYPKRNWLTFHYCIFNEFNKYQFDEYKVMLDQSDYLTETMFTLLERLENYYLPVQIE